MTFKTSLRFGSLCLSLDHLTCTCCFLSLVALEYTYNDWTYITDGNFLYAGWTTSNNTQGLHWENILNFHAYEGTQKAKFTKTLQNKFKGIYHYDIWRTLEVILLSSIEISFYSEIQEAENNLGPRSYLLQLINNSSS